MISFAMEFFAFQCCQTFSLINIVPSNICRHCEHFWASFQHHIAERCPNRTECGFHTCLFHIVHCIHDGFPVIHIGTFFGDRCPEINRHTFKVQFYIQYVIFFGKFHFSFCSPDKQVRKRQIGTIHLPRFCITFDQFLCFQCKGTETKFVFTVSFYFSFQTLCIRHVFQPPFLIFINNITVTFW